MYGYEARGAGAAVSAVRSYQVRYAHTTQRETFSTEDAARSAVLVVYPGAHEERVDGGHSTELHYWADEAASERDVDGSRTCARIVQVQP